MPKISIVVPVYNVEQYLDKCVESILSQTFTDFELLLIDDGSKDSSGKLCDEIAKKDSRITVYHKPNGGLSDARNYGIDRANGEYLTFIDSDDYVEADYLEILINAMEQNGADLSISSHKAIYSNGTVLEKQTGEISLLTPKTALHRLLYDEGIDLSAWAKLYKASLFKDVRFPKGRYFEDAATTYLLIDKAMSVAVHSKSTYNYMIRTDSITGSGFTPKKMHLITSPEEMCSYLTKKYPDFASAAKRRLMYAYLSTLSQLAMSDKPFPKEQKILMDYVKANGKEILKDGKVGKRDKLGIISAMFGFRFYKTVWEIYRKISGRK